MYLIQYCLFFLKSVIISKPQEWHVILQKKNGKIVNLVIKSYLKTLNL